MRKIVTMSVLALSMAMGAQSAVAADEGDAIEYRQGVFNAASWNFQPLVGMAKGEIEFDATKAQLAADRLAMLSGMALEGFEGGPHQSEEYGTHAKDAIWDNWSDFKGGMQQFKKEAKTLEKVAEKGSLGPLRQQVAAVGETCKQCHDNFKND